MIEKQTRKNIKHLHIDNVFTQISLLPFAIEKILLNSMPLLVLHNKMEL